MRQESFQSPAKRCVPLVKEMKERKRDLEVVEFPGVGHAPALMSDDQIGVAKDFLLRA